MKYIKENIAGFAKSAGFISSNLEKVIRLLGVLDFLFSKSTLKDALVLKGGTAINLVHTNLKRLSVDIDLDYCGSLNKDVTLKDREVLARELDAFMVGEEYEISQKSRSHYALLSRIYRYENAFGNNDTIKVDINFMDRVHLYPTATSMVAYFGKSVAIRTLAIEELFGMKINALIDRSKPRDIYDADYLVGNMGSFGKDKLRKAVVFYLSLNNVFSIDDSSFKRIRTIDLHSVKTELLPVLKKGERVELEEMKATVIGALEKLLNLTEGEKEYLTEFAKGNYDPSLLFDEPIASKIKEHPMAKWRIAANRH